MSLVARAFNPVRNYIISPASIIFDGIENKTIKLPVTKFK
jgi:hypothetical protein